MCSAPAATCAVDVGEHDVRLHDAELPVVDRHDRTMAAQMPAAAARLGVADDPPRAVAASAASRSCDSGGRPGAIGHEKMKAAAAAGHDGRRGPRSPQNARRALRVSGSARRRGRRSPPAPLRTRRRARRRRRAIAATRRSAARTARTRRCAPTDSAAAHAAMTGAASRVAVCIGRWNADQIGRRDALVASSFSFATSTHVDRRSPPRRSQAAGDARPNGWRPSS